METDDPEQPEQRYYLYDGSQTVRQTVNEQAEPTYAWTFSPEGAVLLGEEGPVSHLSCVGDAVYDWSTGLIFKGGKYYDPRSDLWLTFGSPAMVWAINRYNGYGSKRKDKKQGPADMTEDTVGKQSEVKRCFYLTHLWSNPI